MTSNYKQVEKELTIIINSNIKTTNEAKLKFHGRLAKRVLHFQLTVVSILLQLGL